MRERFDEQRRIVTAAELRQRLVELTGSLQGGMIVARADHAMGIVTNDAGRLREAGTAFEWAGSPLLAAEVALDLADVSTASGDDAGAHAAIARARRLLERLDGPVVTPTLRRHWPIETLRIEPSRSAGITNL